MLLSNKFSDFFENYSSVYIRINLAFFIVLLIKINKEFALVSHTVYQKIALPLQAKVLVHLDDSFLDPTIQDFKSLLL